MSLRNSLKATVAGCRPQQMQHATFKANAATDHATTAQLLALNPHETWVSGATNYATGVQLPDRSNATQTENNEKLQVAFVSTCNTQPGSLTAHRLAADLIKAAMRACDRHGDDKAARADMRRECLDSPMHLQADLLDYFNQTYGVKP